MTTIGMTFALSAPARRALLSLPSPRMLEFIAERFFDKLKNERYREFAFIPEYFTTPHGYRFARKGRQRPPGEKLQAHRVRLTLKTFRVMKKLETRGLNLTWLLEEILYFGFKEGWIEMPVKEIDDVSHAAEVRS